MCQSSLEMSPGCGFTMPKKTLVSSSVDRGFFSKDDGQTARVTLPLGMGQKLLGLDRAMVVRKIL